MKISRFLLVMVLIMGLLMPAGGVLAEEAGREPITFTVFYPDGSRRIPPEDAEIVKQVEEMTGVRIEWIVPPRRSFCASCMTAALSMLYSCSSPWMMFRFPSVMGPGL